MMQKARLFGITAFVAIIGFSMMGCRMDPAAPTIFDVTVDPGAVSVMGGRSHDFTATVWGFPDPPQTVMWEVEGGVVETHISDDGRLSVASNETATAITVRAISTSDNMVSGTATVTVLREGQGGLIVPGATLASRFAWLRENASSGGSYIVELSGNETIGPDPMVVNEWDHWGNWIETTTSTLPTDRTNLTISLRGGGAMRSISLSDSGNLFVVGSGITLVLDDNISLVGRHNNNHLVRVNSGGTLVMNEGARITGNTNSNTWDRGGGVRVNDGGTFEMRGGEIADNSVGSVSSTGGGVHIDWGGTFRISDGVIHGSDAATGLQNTATATSSGAALFNSGTAQRGTFNADGVFISLGILTTINSTIHVADGVLQVPDGGTLAEQLAWLRDFAQSDGSYVVELSGNETIGPDPMVAQGWDDWGNWTQTTTSTLPTDRTNLTITLRGGEAMRTISLSANGNLFVVGSGVTLVLDDNISLVGHNNDNHLVRVNSGGTLVINEGARITGNTNSNTWDSGSFGGGVRVNDGGTFEMRGGEVADNSASNASNTGGGVHVASGGMFRISDGVIHGSDAAVGLQNTATATSSGAALFNSGTAQRGTFNADGVFTSLGILTTINSTIHVADGVLQVLDGGTLAEQLAWLRDFAQSDGSYVVELSGNETIGPDPMVAQGWDDWGNWTQTTTSTLPTDRTNLTITLRGGGAMRSISLSDNGNLFRIGPGVTLVLDDNITLMGHNNDNHLVRVNSGGTLVMNEGARITGNTNSNTWDSGSFGGGVRVNDGGTFEMRGGEIADNSTGNASNTGGGVHVASGGTFRISDGVIHGSDAATGLQNTATATSSGAALFNSGTAQRGTFNADGVFTSLGNLTTTDGTIHIIDGVLQMPEEGTLAEQFVWLRRFAQSGGSYVVELSGDETIAPEQTGWDAVPTLPTGRTNLTVTLRGDEAMRTISLSANGNLFVVGSGVTLVLDDNITLMGRHNDNHLVRVNSGGTLVMNEGARITGNTNSNTWDSGSLGGGVRVNDGGTFEMRGGEIADNSAGNASSTGGGVHVASGGTFRISDGVIHGSDAAVGFQNTATATGSGATLFNSGTAQRGAFNAHGVFASLGNLTTTDGTIRIVNGALPELPGTVSITGILRIGHTLTANTVNLGGSGAISFQWRRGTIDILGATDDTYDIQTADVGSAISVVVTRQLNSGSATGTAASSIANIEWAVVSTGEAHTIALEEGGTLWAWGNNANDQLGDSTTTSRNAPVQVGTATNWATVSAGGAHTVAVTTDGQLWAWGNNANGQLGNGTTSTMFTPIQIGTASDWAHVSAGNSHTVAIRTDGTLWAWGNRESGRIGQGQIWGSQTTPIQIGAAANWAHVSAGDSHTVAITTTGELWAWGNRENGRIGEGEATGNQTTPIQVGTDRIWATASAGASHTVAVTTTGELWAWGNRENGRIGEGETTGSQTYPIQVGTATNWATASAGDAHTVAVRTDGTAWAWGNNTNGQLGDGTTIQRDVPVQIGALTSWAYISAGGSHAAATRTDGTLWAWGNNASGQVGDNTTTHRNSPVQVVLP